MGKKIIVMVLLLGLVTSMLPITGVAVPANEETAFVSEQTKIDRVLSSVSYSPPNLEADFQITYPQKGYYHIFQLQPFEMPIMHSIGIGVAVVVGRSLTIDTNAQGVDYVQFITTRMITGTKTERWDYKNIDGLNVVDAGVSTGLYTVTALAYVEGNPEPIGSDSLKIIFIKIGGDNFGVWVNTRFDQGEMISTPLQIGINEFSSMLNTGEKRQFQVPIQHEDDTRIDIGFTRTKIMNNTENVVVTDLSLSTSCDVSKDYEFYVEFRFPFIMLDGGQPSEQDNPYFSAKMGYVASSEQGASLNKLNTSFYFGREDLGDPRVFRLSLIPETVDPDSQITYFTSYTTVDSQGNDVFSRVFSVLFKPAVDLTITTIPREAKISYDFGRSAGVATDIAFRAQGGLLDDIVQQFSFDPLPAFIAFDLTIIGAREFIYECDRSYNVSYALHSVQNGELVSFKVTQLPERIHASWGLDIGEFGDLSASSFVDLNMSRDIDELALFFFGDETPFLRIDNFPRRVRLGGFIDVPDGTGNFTIMREQNDVREINVNMAYDELMMTKTFELNNSFMELAWDIDLTAGVGDITITRDTNSVIAWSTSIMYKGWTFSKSLQLTNTLMQLSWDVNRADRRGRISLHRDSVQGNPLITASIAHDTWVISDTFEMKNKDIEVYWDLPTVSDPHTEFGIYTGGGELFHNTLSVVDNGVQMVQLGFGIETDDHFYVSFDYDAGVISNFDWSGRILRLTDVEFDLNLVGEVFTIEADLDLGESGMLELGFNKAVSVTFLDAASNRFKLQGDATFFANRKLQVTWSLGESGSFTVYTFNQPLGESFSLEFGFDPSHSGNYKYGFNLTGENFIQITRTIQWYSENGVLQRIWILGDLPLPGDWDLHVLWNYVWYDVPWQL